jgi:hypothetical protein
MVAHIDQECRGDRVSPASLLFVAMLCASVSCGASARQKTLLATLATVDGAEVGLVAFDRKYQDGIVAVATSEADGHAKLVAYRAQRDEVTKAITTAYVVLGQAFNLDTDASMAAALAAATIVAAQLKELGL